jgi:hypothetical protein
MTTAVAIILGALYMVPGFVIGIFAWDAPTTSSLDYAKRVALHTAMCIFWLPFVLWCISPWSLNASWKEYFKECNESEKFLRWTFGKDYEKMMKKYGKYMPKNNNK